MKHAFLFVLVACLLSGCGNSGLESGVELSVPNEPSEVVQMTPLATMQADHPHMATLVGNAFQYLNPAHGLIDPASGYPLEGWNNDPQRGVYLRSFTQVTAIGEWIELLANIVASQADNALVTREQAHQKLEKVVTTLRADQQDPKLSKHGLLVNFLGIQGEQRMGPLTPSVTRADFDAAFGAAKAGALWKALVDAGWLKSENQGAEGVVLRSKAYGAKYFKGPLKAYDTPDMRDKVMALLDRRSVQIAYGDNANLTASVAKAIGALLNPVIKDKPGIHYLRKDLEAFLEAQGPGYRGLVDQAAGMFSFGRDESTNRFFGWNTPDGKWVIGHQDYLVNEFRDPSLFVVTRFGMSPDLIGNLGFKIKSYEMQDGRLLFALAPYSGASFQAFGLDLGMPLLDHPAWRLILENTVDIELDYAAQKSHPGFLSESYTGEGSVYSGDVGMPALAVTKDYRITDAPSLYTLGTAFQIAPDKMEAFLASNEVLLKKLFTHHGPWEGYHTGKKQAIKFQTTAHTLSLILGALGNGPGNMQRYLDSKQLADALDRVMPLGHVDYHFLQAQNEVLTWSADGGSMNVERGDNSFVVRCESRSHAGVIVKLEEGTSVNMSGCYLELDYAADQAVPQVRIKIPRGRPTPAGVIPNEILTHFKATGAGGGRLAVPLPTTPALEGVRSIEINFESNEQMAPLKLEIRRLSIKSPVITPSAD